MRYRSTTLNLPQLKKHWEAFGKQDAFWGVLTWDSKQKGAWEKEDFYECGRREIREMVAHLQACGKRTAFQKALDFGCGAGRLTQALAEFSREAHGVDISSSMLDVANQNNQFKGRVHFHLNTEDNLALFETSAFDLIYTNIVLQHMPPDFAKRYIREFARLLAPGGLLVFQVPDRRIPRQSAGVKEFILDIVPAPLLDFYRDCKLKFLNKPVMQIFGIEIQDVKNLLAEEGLLLFDAQENQEAGPGWTSFRYFCERPVTR